MLRLDLFDKFGNWAQGNSDHAMEGLSSSHNSSVQEYDHLPLLESNSTLSSYLQVPNAILERMVRNKSELAALQRIGAAASEIDLLVSQIRATQTPKIEPTSLIPALESNGQMSENSIEVSSSRPRDTSHQPVEENFSFDDSSAQSGPKLSSSLPTSSMQAGPSSESTIINALSAMATTLCELEKLQTELERYRCMNLSLVDELLAANCPELAEQKRALHHVETLISEQLERLFSGTPFNQSPPSWETNGPK